MLLKTLFKIILLLTWFVCIYAMNLDLSIKGHHKMKTVNKTDAHFLNQNENISETEENVAEMVKEQRGGIKPVIGGGSSVLKDQIRDSELMRQKRQDEGAEAPAAEGGEAAQAADAEDVADDSVPVTTEAAKAAANVTFPQFIVIFSLFILSLNDIVHDAPIFSFISSIILIFA